MLGNPVYPSPYHQPTPTTLPHEPLPFPILLPRSCCSDTLWANVQNATKSGSNSCQSAIPTSGSHCRLGNTILHPLPLPFPTIFYTLIPHPPDYFIQIPNPDYVQFPPFSRIPITVRAFPILKLGTEVWPNFGSNACN